MVPHCLLENFVILAERTEERKVDFGVRHLGCATQRVVLKLGKHVDVALIRYQSIPIDGRQFIQMRPETSLLNIKDHVDGFTNVIHKHHQTRTSHQTAAAGSTVPIWCVTGNIR